MQKRVREKIPMVIQNLQATTGTGVLKILAASFILEREREGRQLKTRKHLIKTTTSKKAVSFILKQTADVDSAVACASLVRLPRVLCQEPTRRRASKAM
jgi:hypothetical protein